MAVLRPIPMASERTATMVMEGRRARGTDGQAQVKEHGLNSLFHHTAAGGKGIEFCLARGAGSAQ